MIMVELVGAHGRSVAVGPAQLQDLAPEVYVLSMWTMAFLSLPGSGREPQGGVPPGCPDHGPAAPRYGALLVCARLMLMVVLLALLAILCLDIIRLPMTCTKRCVADALAGVTGHAVCVLWVPAMHPVLGVR